MLMADFDDADKNMADTDSLFANLKDLKDIANDYSFLDEEQERAIQEFFTHFSIERRTELKERFISMWDALGDIYRDFRRVLQAQGLAYEGMLYREVIARLNPDDLPYERYVFVGFNVLNRVDQTLFRKLQDAGKALFYWDYDKFYLQAEGGYPHEAGEFLRRNLRQFGNTLPDGPAFDRMRLPKQVTYVSAPTENAQVRYLPDWLKQNLTRSPEGEKEGTCEKETAVVLCNESLLQPVLHSLPEDTGTVNITMGYPLQQTPVYSFLDAIAELHIHGYNEQTGRFTFQSVANILKHPYTQHITGAAERDLLERLTQRNRFFPLPTELYESEFLTVIFRPLLGGNKELCKRMTDALTLVAQHYRIHGTGHTAALDALYRESIFRAYTTVNRFFSLIDEGTLDVRPDTFYRLMQRVMSTESIPFHGEPAIGLQVMGVLETRCLDFKHLILLSVNEGQLPKGINDASFIPYNLRKAFGLTTFEHKIAVFAYYFYRLMQRAERVTLVYNTATDGLNRGEWSRFMLQFLIDWPHPIQRCYLESGQSPMATAPITVRRTPEVMRLLQENFDLRRNPRALLSPTALNAYMECQLRFFFRYVAKLDVPDEVSAEIDSAAFGSIFHKAAELVYKDLTERGNVVNHDDLEALVKDTVRLQAYVDRAFSEVFFQNEEGERPEYNGRQLINAAVIVRYLRQLLQHDLRRTPFTFVASETFVSEEVDIPVADKGRIHTRIGGIIDRIDQKDGTLRIVDYKTGGTPKKAADIEALFTPARDRSGYIFQTFLYASIYGRQMPDQSLHIAPSLLYIHRAASADYSPVIELGERNSKVEVENFGEYEQEFRDHLDALLGEIFTPEGTFAQTEFDEKCAYCDFKALCHR
jgi:hypothetical protein